MLHPNPCLHFGPHQNPIETAGTSQMDQADNGVITLWEYLRREAEKSSRQAAEERKQRSPFWDSRLAMPLPSTGPLCYRPSPSLHKRPSPPETVSSQDHRSEPEFGAARFLCPERDSSLPPLHSPCSVPAPSHQRRRRRRGASVPASEGCANASSLPRVGLPPLAFRASLLDAPTPVSTEGRLHAPVT
ncbi:hypothetical protein GOODEAATRI_026138, partial [Goodea atripinnis]